MAYARSGDSFRWPEGLVPYEVSPDFSASQHRTIDRAIGEWNRTTLIRLVPRGGQAAHVVFEPAEDSCQSQVGRTGTRQVIGCDVGDGFNRGSVMHEIGHAVGLHHEQQRPDRDLFVEIVEENIEPGRESQFSIRMGGVILGPYDYESIMHYPRTAFSTGGDTIVPHEDVGIGQRSRLSELDRRGVCAMYGAPHLVVAWNDDRGRPGRRDVQWAGLTRWGSYCFGPERVSTGRAGRREPNVAMDDERTAVVVYEEGATPRVRARSRAVARHDRFDTISVAEGGGGHGLPDVGVHDDGAFVVAWQSRIDGVPQIRARGFFADGVERIPQVMVDDGSSGVPGGPAVAVGPSRFAVAWPVLDDEDISIRARIFTRAGSPLTEALEVAAGLGDQDAFPRVALAGSGGFAVVYERRLADVVIRGFDASGAPRFPETPVSTRTGGVRRFADIVAGGGVYHVVWADDTDGNGLFQIRARAFLESGLEFSAEETVNPRGGGTQDRPRLSMGSTGRYVVFEDDEGRDGFFQVHAIGARDPAAAREGTLTVNADARGQQRRPAVAAG